jgi:4-amino-4-deoxy-L-arabinose transferase-like glycosyltransferase
LIDWFTLLFFSGFAIGIWVIYISMQTGFPAKPAANVAKLAPGFVPEYSSVALFFAVAATIAWAWLVRWRTGRHPKALWKTLVLPAGGTALCWTLVMTLWLPPLDYARSYIPQVDAVKQLVGKTDCIAELGLERTHIAALRFHSDYQLHHLTGDTKCRWLLVNPDVIGGLHDIIDLHQWRLIRTLRRPTARTDDLLLYQRLTP